MASITHPPVKFTGYAASDLFRSSNSGVSGIPLKALGQARLGMRRQDFVVSAKLRKVKRRERPWPENADPNVKGGILSHLSPFKPLKEKPKPVTLDFERPLIDLEKKINDVRKMAAETGLDFSDQIASLENKYHQALKDLYTHLTPIQRVNIARHPNRPTFLDHVFNITEKFVELHGDRAGYDDPAVVTGIGTINGESYMFIGQQKGRFTKENIKRNFGMPTPQGYRKALRMMYYADHHGFPIVTFIDTPGAFADLKSEELNQGEAIAQNLRSMFGLKVPIVSIVMGEGGSGGALAIGCGNKLLMLENAVFYVASPEACAAILWKSAKASPQAAEKLKITAPELCKLQIADGIIPEPLGGAHADPAWTSQQIKAAILESMDELKKMNTEDLLKHRMLKFRKIGGFEESIPIKPRVNQTPKKKLVAGVEKGIPADLIKKIDAKKKAELLAKIKPAAEVEKGIPSDPIKKSDGKKTAMLLAKKKSAAEARKLKLTVLKAMKSSSSAAVSYLNNLVAKLKRQVDYEYSKAANAMGLTEKLQTLRKEFLEAKEDPNAQHIITEKVNKLTEEFNQSLPEAPNYGTLQKKLKMMESLSRAKDKKKATFLKQQVSNKFKEVLDRPDIKEKIESLRVEVERSGAATAEDLDPELKDKIVKTKKEIEAELTNVLGLEAAKPEKELTKVISSAPEDIKNKVGHLNEKITKKINDVMRSTEVENMVAALKLEVAKAGASPSPESKDKIMALEKEIKSRVSEAINSPELREEQEKIMGLIGSENGRVGVGV